MAAKWKGYYHRALGGESFSYEESASNPNQENRAMISLFPMRNDLGEVLGVVCYARDTLPIYKAEQQLKKSLEEKTNLLESIGEGFFAVDSNWIVIYWNRVAEQMMSISRDQIVGLNLWDVFDKDQAAHSYQQYCLAMLEQRPIGFEDYYAPYGRWYEVNAYPAESGLAVLFRDVTERKNYTESLQVANERFERVAMATNDALWDWDMVNNTLYWGEGFRRLFGYDPGQGNPTLASWTERIHPDDLPRVEQELHHIIDNPTESRFHSEYRFLRSSGAYAYVEDLGSVIRNKQGKALRMVGALRDLSLKREYEASLNQLNADLQRQAEQLLRSNRELEQ
ncbi:MAG: PAS domain S-box protein, partial [Cytophagales bacterium]|nr:PAS domain S-box protein [Cytophagales bacterium]